MKRRSELSRLRVLALLTVVVAALAAAGCGGSSDAASGGGSSSASSSGSAGASNPSTTLNLVGYSTPKKAYDALTTAFAQTSAGKGVGFSSPSAPRARRAAPWTRASPPTSSRSRPHRT